MPAPKRQSPNPDGRPRSGKSDAMVSHRISEQLDADVRAAAQAEGVDLSEWWRRAARARIEHVDVVRERLDDPKKAQWREKNVATLDAIEAELRSRGEW